MKYLKSFNSVEEKNSFTPATWFEPFVYMLKTDKTLDYREKYIPVEYIRSTEGGQYIETGVALFDTSPINFEIDINFMIYGHGKSGIQQSTILCASKEASPWPGTNIRIGANQIYEVECTLKENQYTNWCWENKDKKYSVIICDANGNILRSQNKWGIDMRNILIHFNYEFNFTDAQLHDVTTTLFCSKNGSGTPWRFINARLDYCKLYKNGTLVRDFVPCVNTRGIAGLYDKVNKKFYKSEGDEEFVAGPSIL